MLHLSDGPEVLLCRMILAADETGRLPADCDDLVERLFPARRAGAPVVGLGLEELEELEDLGLIEAEVIEAGRCWRIVHWRRWLNRPRAQPGARTAS